MPAMSNNKLLQHKLNSQTNNSDDFYSFLNDPPRNLSRNEKNHNQKYVTPIDNASIHPKNKTKDLTTAKNSFAN